MSYSSGRMVIISASHPTSVTVGQAAPWSLIAMAELGYVNNPCIGYFYQSGPASSIALVKQDSSTISLAQGSAAFLYLKGTKPRLTTIYSSPVFSGVIFPEAGTYTIQLATGSLSDTAASEGTYSGVGSYYMLVTSDTSALTVQGSTQYSVSAQQSRGSGGGGGGGGGTGGTGGSGGGGGGGGGGSGGGTPPSAGVPWDYIVAGVAGLAAVAGVVGVIVYVESTKRR